MFRILVPHFLMSAGLSAGLAALAVGMLCVSDVAQADGIEDATRPVVAIGKADTVRDSIMHFLAAIEEEQTKAPSTAGATQAGYFSRAFFAGAANGDSTANAVTEKAEPGPRIIIVAAADPYYERWQRDANERLKAEGVAQIVKQHPLAAAHPDKSVIVCEAGCSSRKDEVVYMAAYVPAVAPPRTFEPAASGNGSDGSAAQSEADDDSLPCIAGCYDRPEPSYASRRRQAETQEQAPAAPIAPVKLADAQSNPVVTGAITPLREPPQVIAKAQRFQLCSNGAIIEQAAALPRGVLKVKAAQHILRSVKAAQAARLKTKILKTAVLTGWQAKVTRAEPQTARRYQHRTPVLRAFKNTRHAIRPQRYARIVRR
ncbi:MAG: hypothetical protein ABL897_13630 [Hyphomicrobium sp.]